MGQPVSELRRDLILGSATLLVIALILAVSFIAFREDEQRHARLTAEAPATIVELYERRGTNREAGKTGGIENVFVRYRYEIEGKEYSRQVTMSARASRSFKVGQPAKVCYNPRNREEVELFASDYQCGK
jgi:hypothetical protein